MSGRCERVRIVVTYLLKTISRAKGRRVPARSVLGDFSHSAGSLSGPCSVLLKDGKSESLVLGTGAGGRATRLRLIRLPSSTEKDGE